MAPSNSSRAIGSGGVLVLRILIRISAPFNCSLERDSIEGACSILRTPLKIEFDAANRKER